MSSDREVSVEIKGTYSLKDENKGPNAIVTAKFGELQKSTQLGGSEPTSIAKLLILELIEEAALCSRYKTT